MADVKKSEGVDASDAEKRQRVKARWSMLRQALLGSSSGGNAGTVSSDRPEGSANRGGRFHELSMNSFPGFRVLDRTVLSRQDANAIPLADCDEDWDMVQNSYTSAKGHHKVQFLTREAKEQQPTQHGQSSEKSTIQSRVEALLSHRNYGVDNTGNVRVWDAESTLAGFLLSVVLDGAVDDGVGPELKGHAQLSTLRKDLCSILAKNSSEDTEGDNNTSCNLLELGAGQAGLAGLAMSAASVSLQGHDSNNVNRVEDNLQMKPMHVILTDGHPKCVGNNETCAKMILSKSEDAANEKVHIQTRLLLWDSSSNGANECSLINKLLQDSMLGKCADSTPSNSNVNNNDEGMYQLCLASDCVHFQEFHDGLLTTIARTLAVGGIGLLCQPKRGTSLQNFMALIDSVNSSSENQSCADEADQCKETSILGSLFHMVLLEDFHPKVSAMHNELTLQLKNANDKSASNAAPQCSSRYDPNLHRPLMLVLRKLRPYDEEIDGKLARQHVKMRVK